MRWEKQTLHWWMRHSKRLHVTCGREVARSCSQQDSKHKRGLDQPSEPLGFTHQIPLGHHSAEPLASVVDVAIQAREAALSGHCTHSPDSTDHPSGTSDSWWQAPRPPRPAAAWGCDPLAHGDLGPDVLQLPSRGLGKEPDLHCLGAYRYAGGTLTGTEPSSGYTRDILEGTYKNRGIFGISKRGKEKLL